MVIFFCRSTALVSTLAAPIIRCVLQYPADAPTGQYKLQSLFSSVVAASCTVRRSPSLTVKMAYDPVRTDKLTNGLWPWELINWLGKCGQFQPHHLHNPTCDATWTKKSLGDVSAKWLKQLHTIIKNGIYMWFWSLCIAKTSKIWKLKGLLPVRIRRRTQVSHPNTPCSRVSLSDSLAKLVQVPCTGKRISYTCLVIMKYKWPTLSRDTHHTS